MKNYKINYFKVLRNVTALTLITSLVLATIQLNTLG